MYLKESQFELPFIWMSIMKLNEEFRMNANSQTLPCSPNSIQYTWSDRFDTIEITKHSKTMLPLLSLWDFRCSAAYKFPQLEKEMTRGVEPKV